MRKTRKEEVLITPLKKGYLRKKWKPRKLDEQTSGLYKIVQTHVNGTVTIQLRLGLTERII
jgi:hypothetical protein